MLTNHYNSLYNIHNTRDINLIDIAEFFKIGTDNLGREQIVVRTGANYNPNYVAVSDLVSFCTDLATHYNTTISQLNDELDSLKQRLSEFENLEPANDIVDRIEKLEFLIQEN